MFCRKCGTFNKDGAQKCTACGFTLPQHKEITTPYESNVYYDDKTGLGIALSLFLGLLGLIIGACIFDDYEKKTFLTGWLKGL